MFMFVSAQIDDIRNDPSDDVELAHRSLLGSAALVEPLPVGWDGQDGAVLAAPSIRLQGDLCLPVLEAHSGAWMVQPQTVGHHIVDAQPDVLLQAEALACILVELIILITWLRGAQNASFSNAVFNCSVEGLFHWISQEALAKDLRASQTNWGRKLGDDCLFYIT